MTASGRGRARRTGGTTHAAPALAVALAVGAAMHPAVARADDRAAAQEVLSKLDPASTDEAVKQARTALERATRMHDAGDDVHARLAEALALEWAEAARERARTLAAESDARAAERAAIEAGARVEREHALLEDAIARGGRLRAELATLAAKAKEEPTKPSVPGGRAAARRPAKPAPGPPSVDADAPASGSAPRRPK
jgi:hypothetical protein